ncbi:hypothetical protein E2542_SST07631 [Spatholobus suberectus]|nr:hypothetical protein E2542_SST07631 [Spatholobus suberectus]
MAKSLWLRCKCRLSTYIILYHVSPRALHFGVTCFYNESKMIPFITLTGKDKLEKVISDSIHDGLRLYQLYLLLLFVIVQANVWFSHLKTVFNYTTDTIHSLIPFVIHRLKYKAQEVIKIDLVKYLQILFDSSSGKIYLGQIQDIQLANKLQEVTKNFYLKIGRKII